MTYSAFGPNGPRIAMAISNDLFKWQRLGLIKYHPFENIDFNGVNNKDACLFPVDVFSLHGHLSIAMLHRPLFPGTSPEEIADKQIDNKENRDKEEIWISYCNLTYETAKEYHEALFTSDRKLAIPISKWKELKIGSGAPPILTKQGWLLIYHGVEQLKSLDGEKNRAIQLSRLNDTRQGSSGSDHIPLIITCTKPQLPEETVGTIANVVFPTGVDRRDDIGQPHRIDVYYGMAETV